MKNVLKAIGLTLVIGLANASSASAETIIRSSAFVYDLDGLLTREIVEPGDSSQCLVTDYLLDAYGNRVSSTFRNCNAQAIPGVGVEASAPPAPPTTAATSSNYAQFTTRTRSSTYGTNGVNAVAGQYPTLNTNELGHQETQEFDGRFGSVTKKTGPNGLSTTWTYDDLGRKILETRADGSRTYWEYLPCGSAPVGSCPTDVAGIAPYYVVRSGDVNSSNAQIGAVTRTYYDLLNRPIRSQTQIAVSPSAFAWKTQDTRYDNWGRIAKKSNVYLSDATGHIAAQTPSWTYFAYDLLGRLIREDIEDPSATNAANRVNGRFTNSTTYAGLVTVLTNTKGQTTTQTLNVAGQLASTTDAQGNIISNTYDAAGNLIKTDAAGIVSTFTYDLRGRKLSMTEPTQGTWLYRYNALGELRLQQNSKGQLTTTAYDQAGRPIERREADLISTWVYDTQQSACAAAPSTAKGKPTRVYTSTGYERIHCYDSLGREIAQRVAMDGKVFWSGQLYEAGSNRLLQRIYPARVQPNPAPTANVAPVAGFAVANEFSPIGLIRQKNQANNTLLWELNSVAANGTGRVEKVTLGNQLIDQLYTDSNGRAVLYLTGPALNSFFQYDGFSFDSESNLTKRSWRAYSSNGSFTNRSEDFSYDSLNRVTGVSSTTGLPSKTITYDKYGNLLTKDGVTYTYGNVSKPLQLTQITGSIHGVTNPGYTYDAAGNILTGGGATISWTSFGMVKSLARGSQSSSFLYGPEHQRVKQTAAYNGQNITTWYLDDFELEYNAATNTTQAKYYVAGRVLRIEEGTSAAPSRVEIKYLHKDHLGSVVLVSNSTGGVQERYSYDTWGKRRNPDGTDYTANGGHLLGTTDRGYTGHEQLDHLGLVHMNGRIYDASAGRFMSADPFIAQPGNLQNYNRYAYVNNNPLSYTDPSGYFLKKLFGGNILRAAVTIAVGYYTGNQLSDWLLGAGGSWASAGALTGLGKVSVGVGSGLAAGLIGSGGDLKSALYAGLTGGAFGYAGTFDQADSISRYLAHATAGCISSSLSGEDCKQGATVALAGKYVTNNTPASWGGPEGLVAATVAGGTVSVFGGGKFANGAVTAAFGYLFNCMLNECLKQGAIGATKMVGGTLTVSTGATICGTTGVGCLAGGPMMAFGASDATEGATMLVDAVRGVTSEGFNPLKVGVTGLLPNAGTLVYDSASLAFSAAALAARVPLYVGVTDGITRASSLFGVTTSRWDAPFAFANSVTGQVGQILNRATLAGSALWKAYGLGSD
ncbi:hypothetical protein NQT62_04060 [Limnobacter humi]|uniref:Teneurin-like YD-shell domain-containing protein n=1 Tax=Limnobacter humi TaxID=1778671 RepID=A0ABT1WDM5_9BURK|nr:RHS repeat-associated core domain-containing protein [Limnobacter humi]MCQ8895616.1 hypothetical protein [Limnobacter humi]